MHKTVFFLVLYFLSSAIFCQDSDKKSLLWEISGKGLKEPSYIFGTFHILCKDQFKISKSFEAKLIATKQFCGELNMDDPTLQSQLMQLILMPDKNLESFIDSPMQHKFDSAFEHITGIAFTQLNHYKPFLSLSLLALKTVPCSIFVQPETEIMQMAKKNQLGVLGLETVTEQMSVIDEQPIDSQMIALKKMVLNFDSTKNLMKEMVAVYQQNDAEALYSYIKKQGDGGFNDESFIVKRNQNWIPKIKTMIREKPTFFAVGAGHLGGQTGVLTLLRKQGFTIKPVKY